LATLLSLNLADPTKQRKFQNGSRILQAVLKKQKNSSILKQIYTPMPIAFDQGTKACSELAPENKNSPKPRLSQYQRLSATWLDAILDDNVRQE
jgi:hypothetical protein